MFRRSALPAAVSLAAVLLAVTGCKIQVSGAAPGGTSTAGAVQAGTSGVTRSGPLIVEPGAGFSRLQPHQRRPAQHQRDHVEFSDTTAEHDLAAAAERGVRVRVILDRRARSVNSDAYSYLGSHRVAVDLVLAVSAITTVFNADFKKKAVRPGDGSDLVRSPTDSQDHLIGLIHGATSSLRIYSEEMGDRTIENALIKAAKRGVDVQVCGENESGEYDSAFAKLARAGIRISYYSSSTGFYIHGKVVEADYGTKRAKIFVGSENFSNTSLNQNRELGLIISGHAVMSAIAGTFATDFRDGRHWSSA